MKAYSFSMEKVLEWRQNIEKNTMEKFAIVQSKLSLQQADLEKMKVRLKEINERVKPYKNIEELKQKDFYKVVLVEQMERQEDLISKSKEELEEMRLELIQAQKDRKIMEKLREKDINAYEKGLRHMEQKEIDEMAVMKYKKEMN